MTKMAILMVAAVAANGCKKNAADASKPTSTAISNTERDNGNTVVMKATKPMTADDRVKWFHDCWGFWNVGQWADLKRCYTPDAVSEAPGNKKLTLNGSAIVDADQNYRLAFPDAKATPQLVLVNGKSLVGVTLMTGRQSGLLKTPTGDLPPTNNHVGFFMGQVITVDDRGQVSHERDYFDMTTMLGQLKPTKEHPVRAVVDKLPLPEQVVIAKDDAGEKKNLGAFVRLVEKFNKHDVKGFADALADDVTWSEQATPQDETKKDLLANTLQLWKAFSDLQFNVVDAWAAGDYVVASETFDGTNDGDLAMMHASKTGKKVSLPFLAIHKLAAGKIQATWIFFQGAGFASQLGLDQPPAAPTKK